MWHHKKYPRKKIKIKSLATSPPRKDSIPNQDKNTLCLEKYQSLPPHITSFPIGFKSLKNEENDDNPEIVDTSRTGRDDMSHTD